MLTQAQVFSRMIKLSHSIFAMPFALAAAVLAGREVSVSGLQMLWIVLCLVAARSSAMGFNRVVDRHIDAANPRTEGRELPAGQISVGAAWGFTLGSAAVFVACTALLGHTVLLLSPVVLLIVWGYSLTKRFTSLCHVVLGVALALAPTGVWIALTDSYGWVPFVLSAAVGSWVAGFDIIYSCQDADYDSSVGLHSVPAALGLGGALVVSAGLHVLTMALLVSLAFLTPLGPAYWVGVVIIGLVLAYEHWLVSPDDLSRVDKAFFDLNGYVSLAFLLFVTVAVWAPAPWGLAG